jgi:hypothetical protein
MRRILFMLAALTLVSTLAQAEVKPEFRPFAGVYVPTGDQRDVVENSLLIGGQGALEVNTMLHLVGTLAYTATEAKAFVSANDVHMYQYDLGVETFRIVPIGEEWTFRPFIGAGGGARTHDFFDRDAKAETYATGYGALGAEFQLSRVSMRLEARDYIMRFKGLMGDEKASTRNDLLIAAGLAFHLK